MPSYNEILLEWETPREIVSHEATQFRSRWMKTTIRVLICLATIEILFFIPVYILINSPLTDEFPIDSSSLILPFLSCVPIAAIGLIYLYGVYPILLRTEYTYRITDTGIETLQNKQRAFFPWSRFKGYWLTKHETFSDYTVLVCLIDNFKKTISLSENIDEKIITFTLDQHITLIKEPSKYEKIILSGKQVFNLSIWTLIYTMAFATFYKYSNVILWMFYITLLFGPGTLGMFFYYRNKLFTKHELGSCAFLFNIIAAFLLVFMGGMIRLIILVNNLD